MRQPRAALAVAVVGVLCAGCGLTKGNAEPATTPPSMIPRPLVERELDALLLTPEQLNAAMGATGLTVTSAQSSMSDNSATMAPQECLAIDGAAEATVYNDSGFSAERDQSLNDGDKFTHYVKQAVVLFPVVEKAGAFLDASAQQWSACHEYTHTQSGSRWLVGPIAAANGTLEYDRDSTGGRCPRLGLWTRAGAQKQHHCRRQHVQRSSRRLGVEDCRTDRRQRDGSVVRNHLLSRSGSSSSNEHRLWPVFIGRSRPHRSPGRSAGHSPGAEYRAAAPTNSPAAPRSAARCRGRLGLFGV